MERFSWWSMPSPKRQDGPGPFKWLVAVAGLMLPVLGVLTAIVGVLEAGRGHAAGWYYLGVGIALILGDMIVDRVWTKAEKSDEPNLNARGNELVGQLVQVVTPIENGGRGAVRAADTVWAAEGADAAAGERVRIVAVSGTVLIVEPV